MKMAGTLRELSRNLANGFLAAVQFLTIIPVRREFGSGIVAHSLAWFSLVGLAIGALLFGLDRLFNLFLPTALGSALLVVTLVLISGANHVDGFIDTCDGMAAGRTPEQRLAIMRDSHAGSFGVVGACCLFLVKYLALLFLPAGCRMEALLLAPVMSRWAMVYAVAAYPSARSEGMGQMFKAGARWWSLIVATIIALAVCAGLMRLWGLALIAAIWLSVLLAAGFLRRRLGGLTGDTYGAINELTEVSALILIPLFSGGYL